MASWKTLGPFWEDVRRRDITLTLQDADAEALPYADHTFDAVISTMTMCSIIRPAQAVQEISRVLRRGGKFVFIEHIEGEVGSALYVQQEFLDPLQVVLAGGCHLTRRTDILLRSIVEDRGMVGNGAIEGGGQDGLGRKGWIEGRRGRAGGEARPNASGAIEGLSQAGCLFRRSEMFELSELGTRWPISRQVGGVLVK